MGNFFNKHVTISPGSQFLGTEFQAFASKPNKRLVVREIILLMGIESKDFEVRKTITAPDGTVLDTDITSDTGSTAQEVIIRGSSANIDLLAGEQIQFFTASATSRMDARVQFEEVDNSPERAPNDPKVTR